MDIVDTRKSPLQAAFDSNRNFFATAQKAEMDNRGKKAKPLPSKRKLDPKDRRRNMPGPQLF